MLTLGQKLAENMRKLRGAATQREFARKLGISAASLNRIESASQNVSLATVERICRQLRCTVGSLFGESSS
jgi:DNA-binding Xre family transcriptional regulator